MDITSKTLAMLAIGLLAGGCAPKESSPSAPREEHPDGSETSAQAAPECAPDEIECNERIYQLEETLFAYEAGVARKLQAPSQQCWEGDVNAFRQSLETCTAVRCREAALLQRIASLHAWQAEDQRATFVLPPAPELIAVLAPETSLEGSSAQESLRFEARGDLVHATSDPEHMGIAVREHEQDHVFIFEMDIGSDPSQDEVRGLVGASPTAKVLIRGYRLDAPTGVANFDPARCRWAYLLPT